LRLGDNHFDSDGSTWAAACCRDVIGASPDDAAQRARQRSGCGAKRFALLYPVQKRADIFHPPPPKKKLRITATFL